MFSICARTISRIWHQLVENLSNGLAIDVSSKKRNRVGRKRLQVDLNKVSEIPLRQRTNIRSLSFVMQVAKSILHRRIKDGLIRPHSNALKPSLTEKKKKARLLFCLSMLEQCSLHDRPTFCNMLNYVHIDEKWFYMSKEPEKYYLLPEENEPVRTCKSKRFITKVMFLTAVAKPRFDTSGHEVFSRKIGIFPFICKVPAKRSSKNRMVGTLETKPMSSITKDIIRSYLIEKVLPAIRAKWPCGGMMETIYIQQDNAKPHIDPLDAEFLEGATKDGFDIWLTFQPPNSLDLNVLGLGYIRAIQSLQYQQAPTTIDELVDAIEKSFNELLTETLDNRRSAAAAAAAAAARAAAVMAEIGFG
ncbi:uncharacterized protein LOC132276975 [Cornus florida]|uniref:uncharacterized protein LOC132276975 n=1 Tax=Cornus florida TaxID=4283 RepID=UPI00289F95C7|nr:uncharacterized protein LOC132276975 [Cornus florida]